MKIQVLGTGCPKCHKLAENADAAAKKLGVDCELVKITDINEVMALGVMLTPALTVDSDVRTSGKVTTLDQIKAWPA